MRKVLLLATFAVVALSSTLRCEAKAFLMFPFRFDYNHDKNSNQAVKSVSYASPFTGKTYSVDYRSNFGGLKPPPAPVQFNFDWMVNKGMLHSAPAPPPPPPQIMLPMHPFFKTWRWDANWNKGGPGKQFNWDLNWNLNHGNGNGNGGSHDEEEEEPAVATTEKTTTVSPAGNGNALFHKTVDIKVSFDHGNGSHSSPPSANIEPPKKASNGDVTRDDDVANGKSSDDDDDDENDLDPISSGQ